MAGAHNLKRTHLVNQQKKRRTSTSDMSSSKSNEVRGSTKESAEGAALALTFATISAEKTNRQNRNFDDFEDLVLNQKERRQNTRSHDDHGVVGVKKRRTKTDDIKLSRQDVLDESTSEDDDEETKPGAVKVGGPRSRGDHHEVHQELPRRPSLFDDDANDPVTLVDADLAPERMTAEEVHIQEDEDMVIKKKQYQRVLWFAVLFYALAIIGNVSSFVLLFVNPPPAQGQLLYPLINGLTPAACLLFIATVLMFLPTRRCCCPPTVSVEDFAPDDMGLLRVAQRASAVSLCLFWLVAIPIIMTLPDLQWLGYAVMTWFFAGTVFALLCVRLLRRSKEGRQQRSKAFWVMFVLFFLGLCGATIWRCLNPIYPDCVVEYASWIGDGMCDGSAYNTMECAWDGGDCLPFFEEYPGCIVEYPSWIGDSNCDIGAYNTKACGYDGGDCDTVNGEYPDCHVDNPSWIGDGTCDGRLYGTVECGFDGGDCLDAGRPCRGHRECASEICNNVTKVCDSGFVSEQYPNCSVGIPQWLGDGECDGGDYASEACGFDGGDCLQLGAPCAKDDQCASGFCNEATGACYKGVLEDYPDCVVTYPWKIGNGECDFGIYLTEECGYDGGDCHY